MQKRLAPLAFGLFLAASQHISAQITDPKATEAWSPEPRVVTPGRGTEPPSDAVILFDGRSLNEWLSLKDSTVAKWRINPDSSMTVLRGAGDIMTRRSFGDCQLHVEWRAPIVPSGNAPTGQGRGNSGVFLQNRYEVQVLDSYENRTYSNGQASSIYKQHIPLVNACRPPMEWQVYDIIFTAPRFNADGVQIAPGRLTVLQNGILTQNNVEIKGTTEYIGLPKVEAHGKAPIKLQDHGDAVSYRNIWLREL